MKLIGFIFLLSILPCLSQAQNISDTITKKTEIGIICRQTDSPNFFVKIDETNYQIDTSIVKNFPAKWIRKIEIIIVENNSMVIGNENKKKAILIIPKRNRKNDFIELLNLQIE